MESNGGKSGQKAVEYDRFLPVANIGRIIKNNLPKEVKLSKDAKETFQECVSEFISFITSEASEKCCLEKRKTINGDDVIASLNNLGFEHYTTILRTYLSKYRQAQIAKPESERQENKPDSDGEEHEEEEENDNSL